MSVPEFFKVEIMTPDGHIDDIREGEAFTGKATELIFPALDGFAGIRPGHAQMLAGLGTGALTVCEHGDGGGRELFFAVSGGMLEVVEGGDVTIYADAVEHAAEIDTERARESEERARARIEEGGDEVDVERCRKALNRAMNRREVADKFGGR